MRKVYLPLSITCLLLSFMMLPVVKAGSNFRVSNDHAGMITSEKHSTDSRLIEAYSNLLYDSLHLDDLGLSKKALYYAYRGQQYLEEKGVLSNPDILTVCDFSQPSTQKRMYIIDVKNFKLLMNTYVAHGKNSGRTYAEHFSNRPESLQSSLGFYITKHTYSGKHGLSLRLAGLDRGFNDKAEKRAVVVHGAPYIGGQFTGRSWGCPAVPDELAPEVIDFIKNGTCLFIYYPSKSYLHRSKILNG